MVKKIVCATLLSCAGITQTENILDFFCDPFFSNISFDAQIINDKGIFEDATTVTVSIQVPGFKKEDLSAELKHNRLLIIKGNKEKSQDVKDEHQRHISQTYNNFEIRRMLPPVDPATISTNVEDGILTLVFKKIEDQNTIKINIQ